MINNQYFTDAIAAINAAQTCADLTRIGNLSLNSTNAIIAKMNAQIALLTPMLTPPVANFGSIITWITNYIALIQTPVTELTAEVAALNAQVAALTAAINARKAILGCP